MTPGLGTQRYLKLVVIALRACHAVNQSTPKDFLADLAESAGQGSVAAPALLLRALVDDLEQQSVADAVGVARRLLPGVSLS